MKSVQCSQLIFFLLVGGLLSASAKSGNPDGPIYPSGYTTIMRLGTDLRKGLAPEFRDQINSQPVFLNTDFQPCVELVEYENDPGPLRGIFISAGFVELVNQMAHAMAIETMEKGYFAKYLSQLGDENRSRGLKPLPNITDKRYWTDGVLNEQLSNFNSIVGVIVGIKLTHHYLGHYKKYAAKLDGKGGKQISINNLVTTSEWRAALTDGIGNSLNAGCTVEGAIHFFEAFDEMPHRPRWAAYFLPDSCKGKDVATQLERVQTKAFSGE